jgi:protein-disulfide isomerase
MAQEGSDLIPEPGRGDHVRGALDAPVVLTEFADFECPYCGDAAVVLEQILKAYGSRVALVFRHYPLPMHTHAAAAAEASEAAAAAGKFWEMHDQLFRHQRALGERELGAYAEAVGVPAARIADAIANGQYEARIERDVESGNDSNVEGTPALFVNGFAYEGEVSFADLSETIDAALTRDAVDNRT